MLHGTTCSLSLTHNSKLSSSCAAFIEMLDRDSTLLRVDTQAALHIARYGGEEDGRERERECVCNEGKRWISISEIEYHYFHLIPRSLHSEQGGW